MKKFSIIALSVLLGFLAASVPTFGGDVSKIPYWVYFRGKGFTTARELEAALERAEASLTPKARIRRRRVMKTGRLVDEADLPVNAIFIRTVDRIASAHPRHHSRWLNAVSIDLTEDEVPRVARLPFVARIEPVRRFFRRHEVPQRELVPDEPPPHRDYELDYGTSLLQNLFLNTPELHDLGIRGRGILIGLLDTGFNNLDHNCFQRLDVVAAYDFVNDDDNVGDEDDMGRGSHGTETLSIIAGYDPGAMIGIAHEASFVLAKTENTEWERPVEEDHWVAGIEWMDSLGVEVVSSSLTYFDWYDYEDMDGNTCVTTIAADRAVAVGMVVVVSMGNTGHNQYPANKMGAPADGDSVFAIGAVNRDSTRAIFSSQGPTWDRRIKPDFTTLGVNVKFASARADDVYGAGMGTSFSAPAVAGLCALLIQSDPHLSPLDIRALLRECADRAEHPDTLYGWGIPDGLAAYQASRPEETELVIPLHRGWNTVSHNLDLPQLDVREIFEPLVNRGSLIMVKDGAGRFYHPGHQFCDIPAWEGLEGYQVGVSEDDELTFRGPLRRYNYPMQLAEGWQIIAYLPDFAMTPIQAFRPLVDEENLIIVKDEWGRFYIPEFNFNNIPRLEPGRAYHIKLREDGAFAYPRRREVGGGED